ncbi:MAG: Leucyl aminopeptidase [Hyphomicrobiales bacterium]|nr:Leucyl aminopeptidase [Hyphomicrobiales bacterium]
MSNVLTRSAKGALPVWFASTDTWDEVRGGLSPAASAFAKASGFEPTPGRVLTLPNAAGGLEGAVMGVERKGARWRDPLLAGKLAGALPAGVWRFANAPGDAPRALELAALGFGLSAYSFRRYRKPAQPGPRLVVPQGVDAKALERTLDALTMARDLVNTPANDMGPDALEKAALAMASRNGAKARVVRGAALQKGFPLIHAVGRAAAQEPRLVDITWGSPKAPKVTLVGKGVCFDTGGLDIKPSSAMLLMKKDMAGAATAMALAQSVMQAGLKVRLRVLLPIVENSVSSDAFRPGDVYPSRKGLSVEIGNTDAEGRLILCDALALADEEAPEMMFDFATLTGAARVALGPDLPPFYCTDDALAQDIQRTGFETHDPVWRLPLWDPYDSMLDGKISDINNVSAGPFAGSITAALYLRRFVEKAGAWAHFDIYGWNPSTKPGRPEGGDAQTVRLLHDLLERRFGRGRT